MQIKSDFLYTKDHEWAKSEGATITVGITDHAQSALGDVVFVDLPAVGRTVKQGEIFGAVESIKAVSDLYSPVSGTITEINSALKDEPSTLNQAPYDKGWLVKITPSQNEELKSLLSASDYEALTKNA